MATDVTTIKPNDLRGILTYVPRFKDQVFILAIDGVIVADDNLPNLLVDVAVLRSLGIKIVLVHGIGLQLKEMAELRNVEISNNDGAGVTDAATLELAARAAARVSQILLEGLTQNSLKAVITNSVRALPVGIIKGGRPAIHREGRQGRQGSAAPASRHRCRADNPADRLRPRRTDASDQLRPARGGARPRLCAPPRSSI